jgi:hypothetical protein
MAKYKIIAQEVTGVKGSRYFKNAIVDESQLVKGSIEQLLSAKAISQVEKEAKAEKETK